MSLACLTLLALHTAIRFSGLFAKSTAQRWGLRHLANAAERVAAELIARAVETTGNPNPHPRYTDNLGELSTIGIRVRIHRNGLLIEVWDCDPTPPHRTPDGHLSVVAGITQQWGYYQSHNGGKVIWAKLDTPPQCHPDDLESPHDATLIHRVHAGLLRLDIDHNQYHDDLNKA